MNYLSVLVQLQCVTRFKMLELILSPHTHECLTFSILLQIKICFSLTICIQHQSYQSFIKSSHNAISKTIYIYAFNNFQKICFYEYYPFTAWLKKWTTPKPGCQKCLHNFYLKLSSFFKAKFLFFTFFNNIYTIQAVK